MTDDPWASYVAFRRRALHRLAALARLAIVDEDLLLGAVTPREHDDGHGRGGLLVTGAAAVGALDEALERGAPQWIALLPPAQSLLPAVVERGWNAVEQRSAMTLDDLSHLSTVPMPEGVDVLPVAVRPGVPGYPLEPALRLATEYGEAAPAAAVRDLELEASLLRSLTGIQFFAAVTQEGECVATAGSRVIDGAALVASVATHPSARRRGIGTAMTAVALRAAARVGATEAYLDATAAGRSIYSRLGFAHVGDLLFCERPS